MTAGLGILAGRFGRVALLDMDTGLTTHAHAHSHLILKLSGPDQSFVVEGREVPLSADRAVLVNSWQEHSYLPKRSDEKTLFLAFYIDTRWLAGRDPLFGACGEPGFFEHPSAVVTPYMRARAERFVDLIANGTTDAPTAEGMITEILVHFAERQPQRLGERQRRRDFRIRRVIEQMHEAHHRPFDFDRLARHAGLSRSRFNVLFRESVGVAPAIYGNAIRLEASVAALQGEAGAAEVSDTLGFSAPANFSRFFQQHTGVAPAAYRRALLYLDA